MNSGTDSRRIALTALLCAISALLDGKIFSLPVPFASFLYYEVWEIPVVLGLLILGFWGGTTVALVNAGVLEFVNPGSLPTGPLYNFVAEISMFIGILAAQRVAGRLTRNSATVAGVATASGALLRTGVMTLVNYIVLPMPYPIGFGGFGVTAAQVPSYLVLIGAFNLTLALYTIPIAFSLRRAVGRTMRLQIQSAGPRVPSAAVPKD